MIVVGVALDTLNQMQQHLLLRKYDGFMKKGRIKFRGRQTTGGWTGIGGTTGGPGAIRSRLKPAGKGPGFSNPRQNVVPARGALRQAIGSAPPPGCPRPTTSHGEQYSHVSASACPAPLKPPNMTRRLRATSSAMPVSPRRDGAGTRVLRLQTSPFQNNQLPASPGIIVSPRAVSWTRGPPSSIPGIST